MRLIAICVLFAATLAADVTGKWRGTIITEMASQTTGGEIPAYLVLQQSDEKISGKAGGSEKMLFQIQEGTLKGDQLMIQASPKSDSVLRFTLVVKGDVMEGGVEENGRNIGTAKLTREGTAKLTRER